MQTGGRVMVFRTETGENVLDERPELWKASTSPDLTGTQWRQNYGESIWAGPQGVWWTEEEPYPPRKPRKVNLPSDNWPPDPAWETAPFTLVETTPTQVILRSPVSQLTGLQLTKTVELLPDGKLKLHASVMNCGDRTVTRDLWFLQRVPPAARCFLPLKSEMAEKGFLEVATLQKIDGLTVLEQKTAPLHQVYGKMFAVPDKPWMAAAWHGVFFIVHFQPVDTSKIAMGQAGLEVYCSSLPDVLCEIEHHDEMKTLKPGEKRESEETWEIVPDRGGGGTEAQAHFLQTLLTSH